MPVIMVVLEVADDHRGMDCVAITVLPGAAASIAMFGVLGRRGPGWIACFLHLLVRPYIHARLYNRRRTYGGMDVDAANELKEAPAGRQ